MREDMDRYLNEILPELIELRREIHSNPELSNEEYKTSGLLKEKLLSHGIEVENVDGTTNLVGIIRGGKSGKTVGYRADMDALPIEENTGLDFSSKNTGIMHACGHDIHTTVLYGTAVLLNKFKDNISGNIRIIFQAGEESFRGAETIVNSKVLDKDKMDYILAFHTWPDLPAGTIGLKKGPMMASSSTVKFKINGKGGHAAHPHKSIDPVMIAAYTMTAIQSIISRNIAPLDSAVITFGKLEAGKVSNVIPTDAIAEGSVRTLDPKVDELIGRRIKEIVEYQAKSFGAEGVVEYKNIVDPVINNDRIIDLLEESAEDSIGMENIRFLEFPSMGSEDFSLYLKGTPGALIRLGTNNETEQSKLPLHNDRIIFDEKSIETGVRFMCNGLINILENIKE